VAALDPVPARPHLVRDRPAVRLAVFIGGFVAFLLATFVVVQGCSEFVRIAASTAATPTC
jgi:hypothetical protein